MLKKIFHQHQTVLIAVTLSLILSYLLNQIYQQPFNVDGILYLKIAAIYLQQGFHTAFINFNWPFYAFFIAWIAKLTHLSLEAAAFLLDALLIALLVGTFIVLVKELGGGLQTQYWAILIILIYPFLNHDRTNLLRDFGYYAFTLLSFLFFLYYLRNPRWRYAGAWIITLLAAILFRIEGAFLLGLAPLAVFFQSRFKAKNRLWHFLQLNCFSILILLATIIFCSIYPHQFLDYVKNSFTQFITPFEEKNILSQLTILNPFSKNLSPLFLSTGLLSIFIATVISTLGLLYTLLSIYGFGMKLLATESSEKIAIITYIVINVIVTAAFLLKYFFLSNRYIGTLCFILLLAAPFSLTHIFSIKHWKYPLKIILIIWLAIVAVDGLGNFGTSKTYIVKAGAWIDQNTAATTRVYSNDPQLAYYSRRSGMEYPEDFAVPVNLIADLKRRNLRYYNYLILNIPHKTPGLEQQLSTLLKTKPIKSFSNARGDKVLIFQM